MIPELMFANHRIDLPNSFYVTDVKINGKRSLFILFNCYSKFYDR